MLKWMDDYYIGETVRNVEDIRQKLDQGKLVPGIYLPVSYTHLTLPTIA